MQIVVLLVVVVQVCRSETLVSPLHVQSCFTTPGAFTVQCRLMKEQKRTKETSMKFAMEPVLPCTCKTVHRLVDLGQEYFPRYLPSVDCTEGRCWRGLYRCHQRYYEVNVLKTKDKADDNSYRYDLSLPESLRDVWKFVNVKVGVSCECSL